MGFLFISVFNLISISSVKVGITITQTSNKLSLVIPVVFSYLVYHENISWLKLIGIIVALIAVVLTSKNNNAIEKSKKISWQYMLPVILFISSGIIDTLTKYVERTYLTTNDISNAYLISGFFIAAILGSIVLSYQYITSKRVFNFKNLLAGIVLGVPNYFSIYYLIKALQSNSLSSSATIPINNIGVLFVVSMFGIFIFKEKLNKANYIGLLFTLLAILLIFFGDKF
jgi:drug/metabolite transporter (DMT)-like permease